MWRILVLAVAMSLPAEWAKANADGKDGTWTLTTSALRSARRGRPVGFWQRMDIRLKMTTPSEFSWEAFEQPPQVRAVEIRLPMTSFWVGYEWIEKEEGSRATLTHRQVF